MNTTTTSTVGDQRLLTQLAGAAFMAMALSYIALFILYGAVLNVPKQANSVDKIAYLIANKTLFNISYVIGYVVFACLLCFCVSVVQHCCPQAPRITVSMMSLFGYFWGAVLLCAGMIGISSTELLASDYVSDLTAAETVYYARVLLMESLGGGIELIGGVWLLMLGFIGWRYKLLSKPLSIFTLIKGCIGVLTLFSAESLLRDLFGVTGILWFIWMGVFMIGSQSAPQSRAFNPACGR